MLKRYKASGKIGPYGLLAPVVAAIPSALIGGLYGYAQIALPGPWFLCAVVLLVAFLLLITVMGWTIKAVNCRNRRVAVAAGFAGGVAAWGAAWIVFTSTAGTGRRWDPAAALVLLADPVRLVRAIIALAAGGWAKTADHSLITMRLAWGAEALLLWAGGRAVTGTLFDGEVFCELCETWARLKKGISDRPMPDDKDPVALLDHGGVRALVDATQGPADPPYLRFTVRSCPVCNQLHTLSLTRVRVTHDRNGSANTTTHDLVDNVLITSCDVGLLAAADQGQPPHMESAA